MRKSNRLRMFGIPLGGVLLAGFISACAVLPVKPDGSPEPVPLDAYLEQGARTMWIAPHPDDELFPGSILARSGKFYKNPIYLLVLTHGDGGDCGLSRGCEPDLATIRGQEMKKAAAFIGAELQHERYFNAPLPVSSFPKRHELNDIWHKQGEPERVIAEAIRRFKPDLVMTFDPYNGATGHPEHHLSARLAVVGMRMAADEKLKLGDLQAHRVGRVYQLVNRYWPFVMLGLADPPPVTEEFDATVPCTLELNCLQVMLRAIRHHRTQHADMQNVATYQGAFETISLRQIDPYTQFWDPAEKDD